MFDPVGIMGKLLHGLKESEKELCNPGLSLSLEERNHRRDLELLLVNDISSKQPSPRLFCSRKERRPPSTRIKSTLRMSAAFLTSSTIQVITREWPRSGRNSRTQDGANLFSAADPGCLWYLVQGNWLRRKSMRSEGTCTSTFAIPQGLAPTVTPR